ncbi:ureidoglycolate lyase [Alkalilimnicola ehrlichii]|uniref:Ureidoglycolate lyase n=1 Tax=Alkalilimnicola ehrlichii TaxID=351052 RepID=A0A3E0WZY6_9GAMM|nr:ureidoglycolate lyase [Alkalilimnicola ehrlichii]RFA24477.1 ureidoglycolate lyase [Alkalilimnicola ehrlichii]RFA38485.1 ureidoglycolate lyase [Alkalilimnicola ehrlichii]
MIRLNIEPLTRAAFAPFGEVIDTEQREHFLINNGNCRRYHRLASVETAAGGHAVISVFRARAATFPLALSLVERHPLGSQAFIPLNKQAFLVVVAPPGQPPAPEQLRCFLARGGQGVNYYAGTWHHPLLALTSDDDFLVVDRDGEGPNCEEHPLPQVWLEKPPHGV